MPETRDGAAWLTITEVAHRLDERESTVRSWRDRYRAFVPTQTDPDGRTLYPLERFRAIQQLQRTRLSTREIRAELGRRYPHGAAEGAALPAPVVPPGVPPAVEALPADLDARLSRLERQVGQILALLEAEQAQRRALRAARRAQRPSLRTDLRRWLGRWKG